MRAQFVIPVLASILILGTLGLSYDVFAGDDNNGNNGCVNANPNAKACENNPNTNHPPTIGSVTVTPDDPIYTPSTEQIMTCTESGVMDLDGDLITFTYLWTGAGITPGTEKTFALIGFPFDDFLTCTVTPFDGIDFGEPVSDSVFVTIDPNTGI